MLRGDTIVNTICRFTVLLFVLSLIMVPYRTMAMGLDAGVGYWKQTPSGTLSYTPGGTPVTSNNTLDLKDDLGYTDKSRVLVRVNIELPSILPNVAFLATPMSFEATGKKNVSVKYGDQTFQANVPIQSKLKMDHYDLALYYPFLDKITGGIFELDLGLNARQISFEGTVSQDAAGLSASKTLTVVVPMGYAGIKLKPFSALSIEAEGRGIKYGNNSYYDIMGRVRVNPISVLFISAGYRQETVKLDTEDVKTDIKFAGPFAEVGLSF